jgi:hypothetical protein
MTLAGCRHPSGVIASNADGSVRLVPYSFNLIVWKAQGSMDGGEAVTDQ